MKTIEKIIKQRGYTLSELKTYKDIGICNGIGGQDGINFSKHLRKLKYFQEKKGKKLLQDVELLACIHDYSFHEGKGFIKSNYEFCIDVVGLVYWTTNLSRITLFITLFFVLNIFGIRYYKWR